MSHTYLFELGCEELPSSVLPSLADQFHASLISQLASAQMLHGEIEVIAAPRRLGARICDITPETETKVFEKRGPPVSAAYKEGQPTAALQGFCNGLGISPSDTTTIETEKGAWVVYQGKEAGRPVHEVLPTVMAATIQGIQLAKPMRWGSGRDEFPRPVHWITSVLDDRHIPIRLFGLDSGTITFGHRFHAPEPITLSHANDYVRAMRDAYVIPGFSNRKAAVWESVSQVARDQGVVVQPDEALLIEVTCLVEWPVALCGEFDVDFLEVPDIALIAAMRGHQKYFHTWAPNGSLSHLFITVSNIESRDPTLVIQGNQRVIRARLSDARFFYSNDKRCALSDRRAQLDQITFHPKLGSLGDKTLRVKELMCHLAAHFDVTPEKASRLADLSRCDLVSEMVLEFDELQGQMGTIYAGLDQEDPEIAAGIEGLYKPAGASDSIPEDRMGVLLAIADRLDTLAGLFAANQPPTGSKDPFALRRAAIGLIRLNEHPCAQLDLLPLLKHAFSLQMCQGAAADFEKLVQFVWDRERVRLIDHGLRHDIVSAAQAPQTLATVATERRAHALAGFIGHESFADLVAGNKRIANILQKAGEQIFQFNPDALVAPQERELYATSVKIEDAVHDAVSRETYTDALVELAKLREPTDAFFEAIMVNDEDAKVRHNRLALLQKVRALFLSVGDLSLIQV
jgi:glycyl-tRNA synthetase beta chain